MDKARFFTLMERYNQLGRLLPTDETFLDDPAALAEAKVLITEMDKVKAEIDAVLSRGKAS